MGRGVGMARAPTCRGRAEVALHDLAAPSMAIVDRGGWAVHRPRRYRGPGRRQCRSATNGHLHDEVVARLTP